jgi:hypothetical protein
MKRQKAQWSSVVNTETGQMHLVVYFCQMTKSTFQIGGEKVDYSKMEVGQWGKKSAKKLGASGSHL